MMIAVSKVGTESTYSSVCALMSHLHSLLILTEKEGAREYLIRPSNVIAGILNYLVCISLFTGVTCPT